MSWPKTADQAYYLFEGRVLIPIDPSTGVAQLMLRPQGGMGVGIPAIADGDPGDTPVISTDINLTELAYTDVTPASASFTEISPNTYQLNLSLHRGAPGDDLVDCRGQPRGDVVHRHRSCAGLRLAPKGSWSLSRDRDGH